MCIRDSPFASRVPGSANFADALFTATSAVCVTGLVVQDTALYWSEFGQAVILILIQIGGMGVVTVAVAIAMISGKKISLMQRSTCLLYTSSDTGRGFLREQLKRLNRGEGTQDESGHGLGLRIVRDVARAHGGRVRFDNLPEGGGRCVIDGLHPTRRAGRKISS